jgi:hypothetical protein
VTPPHRDGATGPHANKAWRAALMTSINNGQVAAGARGTARRVCVLRGDVWRHEGARALQSTPPTTTG